MAYPSNAKQASLVPFPQKLSLTDGVFTAPSPYVEREWITFSFDAKLPKEGYRLKVSNNGVTVFASDSAGEFYAMQTLRQLGDEKSHYCNTDFNTAQDCGQKLTIPCCEIEDTPAYRWRGLLLDEGRHFFGKEVVKSLLEMMAYHKLNVFHWHLTEDQGWRLPISRYPLLEKIASVRPNSPAHRAYTLDMYSGESYGPFCYTKEDIKEVIDFAKERHIEVVPEVDLPGHCKSALCAYPELSCLGEKLERTPRLRWGIEKDVLCVGNDDAIHFMEAVLDEVCELFPSKYIHFGGDECPTERWEACPKCQAKAKEIGLDNPKKLQGWVTKHLSQYLANKGRKAIGWDEVLECAIPNDVTIMSWRGTDGATKGSTLGHDVIVTPLRSCYLVISQGLEEDSFQYPNRAPIPLSHVYSFDPAADISKENKHHVLGSQACMWSEYIWNKFDLEWKLWPRGCALAEVLWTNPQNRDFEDFSQRLTHHRKRMIGMGIHVAPLK